MRSLPFRRKERIVDVTSLAPKHHLIVVGDVHGCFALLQDRIKAVDDHVLATHGEEAAALQLVFVGDYIDRGEQSAEVLRWVFGLQRSMPDKVICLMGNHEAMLLDFLDDPVGRGPRWFRNGGLQTLASFGVPPVRETSDAEELLAASEVLEAKLPDGLIGWLRALPTIYQSGNVCVAHAALDPYLSPREQQRRTLLWGHKDFLSCPRDDGNWVVHGHTIVREPTITASKISIDTGAYATGRLAIAAISVGSCQFI